MGSIAVNQAKINVTTAQAIKKLNFCAPHPYDTIIYKIINMVIQVHSDGSHLSESQACRRSREMF